MLVLSRKSGQRVCIGDSVVVTVVAIANGQVRLAIEAPPQVSIDRDEIRQRKFAPARPGSLPEEQELPALTP